MDKTTISAAVAVPLIISGSVYSTATHGTGSVYHSDYVLTSSDSSEALVLIPLANQEYANAADSLYLEPNGFDGTATNFVVPEPSNEVANVEPGVQTLVQAVESQYTAGDFSATDPLYIFGYSQGAVEASLAEQQLANFGIPQDALHFVLVGDSSSAEGGFLNSFVDSFPESLQQPVTNTLTLLGVTPPVLGSTTPDNLYPTDVYTLSGDGWANYDDGQNLLGMFTDHLEYLGLTPAEIASATESTSGLTDYYTIDSADVDGTSALLNTLKLALFLPTAADAVPQAAASTTTGTPEEVLGQAAQDLTQAASVLDAAPTADLGAHQASILANQEMISQVDPILTQLGTLQTDLPAADQTFLADADQQFVTAAQGVLSADQAFVAADQAGALNASGFLPVDLTVVDADLGLLSAVFNVTFATVGADLAPIFGISL
jgi:hypothetical protein